METQFFNYIEELPLYGFSGIQALTNKIFSTTPDFQTTYNNQFITQNNNLKIDFMINKNQKFK